MAPQPDSGTTPPRPLAVVLHGVGSTGEFAARCLAPSLRRLGYAVVAPDLRGHGADARPEPAEHSLDAHVADVRKRFAGERVAVVGGISLGAEVALRWAAELPELDGMLLCLPGVEGPSSATAAANRWYADRVETIGVDAVLSAIAADPGALRWVVEEIRLSWPRQDAVSLVAALRAAAAAEPAAPDLLSRVRVPVGIAAAVDDAAHPVSVAQRLVGSLPTASISTITLGELAPTRARLGDAAVEAWQRAVSASR